MVSCARSPSTVLTTFSRMSGRQRVLQVDAVGVLGRQHDGVQPHRGGAVVLDGDLGLAVGPQVVQHAVLADLGQPAGQPVRQRDRQRHQLGGVLDRVAEHQALVAGALGVQRVAGALDARLVGGVDALGDVGRLRADADVHAARRAVEALVRRVVADLEDALAHGVGDVGEGLLGRRGDLADDVHLPGGHQRLHRDAGLGILREQRVEHRVADGVTDLVGVALGYRLTGKQPSIAHGSIPFRNLVSRIISLLCAAPKRVHPLARNPYAQPDALLGLTRRWCAGRPRSRPRYGWPSESSNRAPMRLRFRRTASSQPSLLSTSNARFSPTALTTSKSHPLRCNFARAWKSTSPLASPVSAANPTMARMLGS